MPTLDAKTIFNRYAGRLVLKDGSKADCGANAKGGHGFQPGNKCATKDGGSGGASKSVVDKTPGVANEIDIPKVTVPNEYLQEAMKIAEPKSGDINQFIDEIAKTKVYAKVNELLKEVEQETLTKDVRYASIEMNIECCPDAKDIKEGRYQYTPERKQLHQKLIEYMLPENTRAEPGKSPQAVLLIGPPGSGKSSAGAPIVKSLGVNFATVNNDEIKTELPEYKGWNAAMVQEESAEVVEKELMPEALKRRHNMIFDGVGKSADKLLEMAKDMKSRGYDIHLVHVTIPTEKTVARAWHRFAKTAFQEEAKEGPGRYVPVEYIAHSVGQKPTNTYKTLRDSGLMDSWASYSNDVPRGEKPKVMDMGDRDVR